MKFHGEKINGCMVLGKDIKDLIFYPSGVLVYKKHHLIFVSSKDNMVRTLWVREEALYPIIFVSKDFDEVEKIYDGEREYVLQITDTHLYLNEPIVGDPKIEIRGYSY